MRLVDVFLDSKEIKRLIYSRSVEFNIPFMVICAEVGIVYVDFMSKYLNKRHSPTLNITEEQVVKVLDILGINVRFQFIIDSEADMTSKSRNLNLKHRELLDRDPERIRETKIKSRAKK